MPLNPVSGTIPLKATDFRVVPVAGARERLLRVLAVQTATQPIASTFG
jgi:hypothetical protein